MSDKINMEALRKGVADFKKELNAYKRDRARRLAKDKSREELRKAGMTLDMVARHDAAFDAAFKAEMEKQSASRKKAAPKTAASKKKPQGGMKKFVNKRTTDA